MSGQILDEAFICRYIRGTPAAFYDIGVGPKSEWQTLGRKYPTMQVFGCEPHPDQYAMLLSDQFPGPLAKVAIAEKEGIATLYVPDDGLKCCSLLPVSSDKGNCRRCEVQVWSLDRFDANMGAPDRILLWMDIEGSELTALRSGPNLMSSGRVRWINLEERCNGDYPAEGWCDPKGLDAFLFSHGYIRVASYNSYSTHQDVIYMHKDEPRW